MRYSKNYTGKRPARSTLHYEVVKLRSVLKAAIQHGWLTHRPDLSPPYKTQGKIVHRPWFSLDEYKQLYTAKREWARTPPQPQYKWNAEQMHDYILFMGNIGLRPDEAGNLEHRNVTIALDQVTGQTILEIELQRKRGVGFCKSTPEAGGLLNGCSAGPSQSAGNRSVTGARRIQVPPCLMSCRSRQTK